ncbi:MAG: hypothetical protein DYH03_10345 [Nitrospira sp. NTP1]|nr:hypothetical protein [Nitrospira sp. NTP1]
MSLLKNIHSPADLKRLSPEQFPELCQEIREQILAVVSNVGGHLASNLGVVELTVALQYLLDTPKDKIVWDTSNQAYTHKLLTGRREQFHTLRQYGGLSGFCKREESAYDTFNAGHAGTGVSAAFGMVEAREQRGEKHKVVCVVGDGAMTAGMTLEGLHHAGGTNKDFIVVLNDNQMPASFCGKFLTSGPKCKRSLAGPRSWPRVRFSPVCCSRNWASSMLGRLTDITLNTCCRHWKTC